MDIEQIIEKIQELQETNKILSNGYSGCEYEKSLLDMAEASLVDLINYWSDGPDSNNIGRQIKTGKF